MGWDAFSSLYAGQPIPEFEEASIRVRRKCRDVDGLLHKGGLDMSDCAYALRRATGEEVWTENPWAPEFVKTLAARAHWEDQAEDGPCWAIESAREFLETCAKLGCGIRFSW